MNYIGEHLLPGQLGHFFIVLSLVASAVAGFAYLRSMAQPGSDMARAWKKLARAAFLVESLAVFAIFGILVYLLSNHLFEYKYAWQHSSKSLEFKYLLAAIWEGQEGSFLLWLACGMLVGVPLIRIVPPSGSLTFFLYRHRPLRSRLTGMDPSRRRDAALFEEGRYHVAGDADDPSQPGRREALGGDLGVERFHVHAENRGRFPDGHDGAIGECRRHRAHLLRLEGHIARRRRTTGFSAALLAPLGGLTEGL